MDEPDDALTVFSKSIDPLRCRGPMYPRLPHSRVQFSWDKGTGARLGPQALSRGSTVAPRRGVDRNWLNTSEPAMLSGAAPRAGELRQRGVTSRCFDLNAVTILVANRARVSGDLVQDIEPTLRPARGADPCS
jgi:hypothetical protein